MFGFLIKKVFFDMWDHLLTIFLLNAGFILLLGGGFYLISIARYPALVFFLAFIVLLLLSVYIGGAAMMAREMAHYRSPDISALGQYIKESWKASCVFGGLLFPQLLLLFVIRWYFSLGTLFGFAIGSVLFWFNITWWIASQYYFPLLGQLEPNIKKIFRKCFLLMFDNTLFTLALALGVVVIVVLSSFIVFLIPGLGTLLLWHQAALKLRMYKYDYLEAHPEATRQKIPWNELLHDEQERLGKRTLRGMIFPWKE